MGPVAGFSNSLATLVAVASYRRSSLASTILAAEISREMYHARLSGVPNDVALNHCGKSETEHFVCISSADGTDYAVTVKFRVYELRRWNRFRGNCSVRKLPTARKRCTR